MTEAKTFHIGTILTVTHDRLVSPDGVDGLYRILNHMTGESLMTHQLPRANDEAAPWLRVQFPDLAAVEIPADFGDGDDVYSRVMGWLDGVVTERGETRDVLPLPEGDHTRIDPLQELRMMRPDMPIIAIAVPEEGA
jgi:hypothetical protein